MNLFRNFGLPVVLMLVCAIGLSAQNQEAISSEKLKIDKNLENSKLLDDFTPLEDYLISDNPGQLVSASTYPFLPLSSVALEDMSSGTTQLVAAGQDDTASAVTNLGFDFWFDGVRYTQFSVNANGLMSFGPTVVNNGASGRTNDFATTTNNPKVAAYWDDLCTPASGKVHYKVTGTPGNRRLVVEWQNMVTFGTSCTTGLAIGTFQVWVYESTAAVQPGVVQFVYGALGANSTVAGGYSIGIGSSSTSFGSVSSATDAVSYATSDNAQVAAIAGGKSYTFTPNAPNAPTGLTFSPVTQTSIQLNWTDNASNEVGYAIFRSTDGTNYSFLTQTAVNAVSFNDTNLLPGTTYFYQVSAVSEGVKSGAISGSQATGAAGNIACAGMGGNWSATSTWTGGIVPGGGDNVTVGSGCVVTIDTAATALSLTVQNGGTLEFESAAARTLTVVLSATIDSGGTIRSNATGTVATHVLSIGISLFNNGTLDLSTNGDTAGAELRFTGTDNASFSGTGATTDLRLLTVQKGAGAASTSSPTLDVNLSNMSVRGLTTGGTSGFLNTAVFNGIVKFSGTNAFSDPVFQTAGYSIPGTGGVWLNNPNFTVSPLNGSPTLTGLLRITDGTLNIGTASGNSMGFATGSTIIVEGGAVNAAGRFGVSASTSVINFNMSGGTVTVQTVGNTSTTLAGFDLGTSLASSVTMTGGTVVVQLANTAASGPRDYRHQSGTGISGVTGGILQLGNAASGAAKTFTMRGVVPNLVISNASAGHTGQWDTTLTNFNNISRNITINPTTTLNLGNVIFLFSGTTFTNNGTLTHNGASSRTYFFGAGALAPQTYTGSGTVTVPATSWDFDNALGVTIDAATSGIVTNRVILFAGNIINANELTIGNGGTTTATVQIGNTTTPTLAGLFDTTPTFNPGSGGIVFSYLRTGSSRVTGPEIPAGRSITNLTYNDNDPTHTLTIAGGNLTVTGSLTLTEGVIVTDDSNVLKHNGTATRTNGYVDGPLTRDFGATGVYTYHVGDGGYSSVLANVTAGTGNLTVRAIGTAQPNVPNPSKAITRYWKLAGTGITSDLTFRYIDPADIPGTVTEAGLAILKYDGTFSFPGGTVDTTANTATITGVTSFSDWTLAETGALTAPGVLALSSTTYSANENAGSVAVTVNRTSGTDGAVTVDYALGGGTATGGAACGAGIDYVNTGGTVSFANGEASKTFNVALCGDTDVEPDETFDVTLSNPTGGATLGTPATATVTILNDDTASSPVTVTASAGTPTGAYATLTAAIAAVNDGTHQGGIVININQNTTEPASVVLNSSGAGAANYTSILIRPTADGLSISGASVQGRGLIELNGADNVTIDGDNPNTAGINRNLTVQNTAANTVTFASVIRIALAATVVNTADNNAFKNLIILGNATGRNIAAATTTTGTENTTFGIFVGPGGSTASATTPPAAVTSFSAGVGTGATAANLLVNNNSVTTAARAVSINGSATTVLPGLQITGNSIGNQTAGEVDQVTAIGITAQGSTNAVISGNTVWLEGFVASSAAGHAINVGVNSVNTTGATIENNKVNRVRNNNPTTWSAYGINLGGGSNHIVQNNFVSGVINNQTAGTGGFGTTFGAYGIRVASGTGHKVYHNSVHLYGAMPGAASTNLTVAFVVVATTQTGLDVRNNVFSNQISGGNPAGTRNAAVYLPSAATVAMNLTLNNNAYFAGSDALNRLAQTGTTFGSGEYLVGNFDPTSTTPATNFRAYTSTLSAAGTNDNASFASSSPPPFTSDVDLHIPAGTATRLESGGAAVGLTTDIDLETRNATTPDIGADEFAGNPAPANDMAAGSFVYPANGATIPTGSFSPQAKFINNGTATQTNVTVRYRILDSSMTVIYNQTANIPTIAPLQNITVSFPTATISTPGTYTMQASAELAGDSVPGNDTINGSFNTVTPISGTVNVGAGGDYTSLTNPGGLFQALNLAGLSSNLTVNITSDLTAETGAVPLNQLNESGAGGYTVTIKPSGAARVISGSSASSAALITLNGADRIIFDGSLSGGTDRSLTITNNQTTTTAVIWMRSPNASNGATNNTIKNCIINGAPGPNSTTTAGVLTGSGTTLGNDAEAPNSNNTIQNNWIYRVQNSMYLRGGATAPVFDQNWTVVGNELGSTNPNDKNLFRGMLIGNSANFTISGNTVHGIQSTATTTAIMSGIQIGLLVNNGTVTNNVISDIKNVSPTGTGAHGISVIATSTASNVTIANNFISDVAANGSATVTSNGYGISFNSTTGGSGYNVYFNSVNMNTNQATAQTSAAMFVNSTFSTAGAINLRNNILANTQTTGTRYAIRSAAAATVFTAIDYNDYFSTGSVGFLGSDRPTLADWQTATGQDANSKAVDPLFVSATNLHLQPTSPLIAMGVSGTGITTDIDGQPRDTPPDIGADEIIASLTPGSVQFSSATYSVSEAGGPVTLTFTRTAGSAGAISATFSTANGTATGGSCFTVGEDYVIIFNGTVNWADGDTAPKTVNVPICNDAVYELDETFTATISGTTGGATIGSPATTTVTITNDDPAPFGTITVNDVRVTEGNTGGANAVFTVTYTGVNPASASVDYATAGGTATSGVDYIPVSGTLNFGSLTEGGNPTVTRTVTVPIIGKTLKEANETFYLNLSNPVNATITDNQGVGIIVDEDRAYPADFDRDLYSDLSIFRPGEVGGWYILQSSNSTPNILSFGTTGDRPVPGDYDGDGKADVAVYRASEGRWYVISSVNASVQITNWGAAGDKPVQGDYDGDGRTDIAVYRPSTGTWWITRSSDNGSYTTAFGISTDRPVQGDYDGDFKTDVAVYRDGTWYINQSSNGTVTVQNFGLAADKPVSGDFDGDGKYDLAVFRGNGDWYVLNSLNGTASFLHWGQTGDIPVPADYDRDGTTDFAIFRPSTGEWYVLRSSNGSYFSLQWGQNGDIPVPSGLLPQ